MKKVRKQNKKRGGGKGVALLNRKSRFDPGGSYTGCPTVLTEPEQDADDL